MQGTTSRGEIRWQSRFTRLWTDKGATELVEFALVVPILFMLLYGMWWFGRAFNIYETMVRAAREGAAYGARPVAALDGAGCIRNFPCTTDIVPNKVLPALQAAKIDPNSLVNIPIPRLPNCYKVNNTSACPIANSGNVAPCDNWNGKIYVCRCVDMNPQGVIRGEACGVSVVMAYPWSFRFPFTGIDDVVVQIPASVVERQEF